MSSELKGEVQAGDVDVRHKGRDDTRGPGARDHVESKEKGTKT